MSGENFVVNAVARADQGKGASRRLRHANQTPAIIYGGDQEPQAITLVHNELMHHLENEAFYSHILTLNVDGTSESVILKDLQRHPYKQQIMHADFLRVRADAALRTHVPLHFINEDTAKGVKEQGGKISHNQNDVEISCLPADLPEFIEVDLADVELGQTVHLSDLQLPSGVTLVALSHGTDHDASVVSITAQKGGSDEDDDAAAAPEATEE